MAGTRWRAWPTWMREGIDQAVLYPTIGLYFSVVDDPAAAVALATAYNDWLASYCAADPRRLFGAAMLPLQDPAAAAAELRRAVERARLRRRLRPAQPVPRALAVGPRLRRRVGRGRRARRTHRDPRGQLGHRADPGIRPPLQPAGAPRRVALLRGDAGLRPAHRVRGARAPPGTALHLPRVLRRLGPVLAGAPRRAGGVLRWLLPRHGAAALGVLRPPVRHQLRGRRAHPAGAGALRRRRRASSGAATTRTTTPPSPAPSTPSVPPSPRARPRSRPRCSGSTPGGLYRLPSRRAGPAGIIDDYFAAVTAHDADLLRGLFAPDATFDVDGEPSPRTRRTSSPTTPSTPSCFEDFRPDPWTPAGRRDDA